MTNRLAVIAGLAITMVAATTSASVGSLGSIGSACSTSTATSLVNKYDLNGFLLPQPAQQVLCGPFTGAGSNAMAVGIAASTCWSPQRWAVFSYSGTDWTLVLDVPAFIYPLVAVGSDIKETRPVFRSGDPRCVPSGGTQTHTWRWNGTRLVAGPWVKHAPQPTYKEFLSPRALQTSCYMSAESTSPATTFCENSVRTATLRSSGRVTICRITATRLCHQGDPGENDPRLRYGKHISLGPFRCSAATAGITCVVRDSGKGFLISRRKAVVVT